MPMFPGRLRVKPGALICVTCAVATAIHMIMHLREKNGVARVRAKAI